ncbi:hypothetical protein FQN54_000456 [Arachnomyces sp. PD_36]|nr:hypothetical protein FQN54_000456 [Arachnomyces sp. PD_36]
MDTLPSLVLHQICSLAWENAPRSVQALSLVNSKCYLAAVPFIYREITIEISAAGQLQQLVEELTHHPLRQRCIAHTRRLNLTGRLFRSDLSPEREEELREADETRGTELWQVDICSARELEPMIVKNFPSDWDKYLDCETWDSQEGPPLPSPQWAPLVSLITKFQFLTELNYYCANPFPSSLLKALHEHQSSCKLNLKKFRFRMFENAENAARELELMRSPCLHGLNVRYVVPDPFGHGSRHYNDDAVMDAIAIAPNLREVRLQFGSLTERMRSKNIPKEHPWRGMIPPEERSSRKGGLICLSLSADMSMFGGRLIWSDAVTNLPQLQSLSMGRILPRNVLAQITSMGSFESLKKLAIHLDVQLIEEAQSTVGLFFENLKPLKTLRLHGLMDMQLIRVILGRHGPSLEELLLHPRPGGSQYNTPSMTFSSTDISVLVKHCPLVRELDIRIKRTLGDLPETTCYEAISQFPSLENLSLELDCAPPPPAYSIDQLGDFYKQVYKVRDGNILYADVQDTFANAAIDETLARSIWDLVTFRESQKNVHLLSLHIVSTRPRVPISRSIGERSRYISHSFRITRGGWYRADDPIDVVEIGRAERESRYQFWEDSAMESSQTEEGLLTLEEMRREEDIMEKIWPPKDGRRDWKRDWSSGGLLLPFGDRTKAPWMITR